MGTLTGDQTTDALLLSKAQATANLFKTEVSAYLAKDAETVKMAALLNGTGTGAMVVNGALVFDPNDPLKSIFSAIRTATEQTSSYLKSISESTGALSSAKAMEQFQAAYDALLAPLAAARTAVTTAGGFVYGENFAAGTVSAGYGGSASQATNDYVASLIRTYRAAFDSAVAAYKAIPGHATGLANVPYDGYLMTAHAGEAVIDAGTISSLRRYGIPVNGGAANDDLLAEIKALRAEVAGLRGEAAKTSVNTRKTADAIVRVTRDGDSMLTATA
jgi:hypothetical protein